QSAGYDPHRYPLSKQDHPVLKRILWPLYFIAALFVAFLIYKQLPPYLQKGGYLVPLLIFLSILVLTFIIERTISLRRAQGRRSLPSFLSDVRRHLIHGEVAAAIDECKRQGGSAASVMRAGLERFEQAKAD